MKGRQSASRDDRRAYDFDLHGIVGVRLLDATRDDLATVARQLGPLRADLDREPDLTIRFVDSATDQPMTYVGLGDTGFDDDGFYVLRGRGGVRARARMPFDAIGQHPQIVCERAMPAVPHLLAFINLTAVAKGVLPLHASAFVTGSLGVLVTGWAKSGKTESLLAGMADDGRYVGDEWVYLTPDRQMLGLPEPIRLWGWHFDQLPDLLAARRRRERVRLSVTEALAALARAGSDRRLPGAGLVRRASPVLERQVYLQVPPAELFGAERIALRGALDSVVLVLSHSGSEITTGRAGPDEVPGRMLASLADERAPFMAHYRQFRYAFPERSSAVVDTADLREAGMLDVLFRDRPAAKVAHPYPCDIKALGRAVVSAAREAARPQPSNGKVTVS